MACASTEPDDSPAPSRTGESSELGEVFGQANLLCEKQLEFPGREAAINVPYPWSGEARIRDLAQMDEEDYGKFRDERERVMCDVISNKTFFSVCPLLPHRASG